MALDAQTTIQLARDYSAYPAGRYPEDGPYNGQKFRDRYLMPALKRAERVVVDIDGIATLPSSFWEEVWGGLVRKAKLSETTIRERFQVTTTDEDLTNFVNIAWKFVSEEQGRQEKAA
ncbi:MAG: DUF4325 domain-containing protein [Caulobacteraceae bacterium]|nr:MAG: DUF4325 domain-containing protein [Caulobacteraceae bacterium]